MIIQMIKILVSLNYFHHGKAAVASDLTYPAIHNQNKRLDHLNMYLKYLCGGLQLTHYNLDNTFQCEIL